MMEVSLFDLGNGIPDDKSLSVRRLDVGRDPGDGNPIMGT